jgi:2-dehydropantoate 2-reductase
VTIDRFIVVGAGAVGGAVAAALSLKGRDVVAVARGAHLEAMREHGLTLRSPGKVQVAEFPCVASVAEITFRPGDAILICTKTQDTEGVLEDLRGAGVVDQPIFCLQNGVENERMALRRFANVHGVLIMMPVDFVKPGEVVAYGGPCLGIFDIGRFPYGHDEADQALADALTEANIAGFVADDILPGKYGKLLLNLGNAVEATIGNHPRRLELRDLLIAEGVQVFEAAGIAHRDVGMGDPRRAQLMTVQQVDGVTRTGSSSTQSLARGAGTIETDWLNGEIVMLGRLHGVPTPRNAWFNETAAMMARKGMAPGSIQFDKVERALGL